MEWLKYDPDFEALEKGEVEVFEKTYHAIRRAFEDLFGEGSWESIPVPGAARRSKAKAQPLPFGAKVKLTPAERARYTTAKRILAAVVGMPTEGWGLYGRSIKARLKRMMEDEEHSKKLRKKVKALKKKLASVLKP
jgi:hypothetical protein